MQIRANLRFCVLWLWRIYNRCIYWLPPPAPPNGAPPNAESDCDYKKCWNKETGCSNPNFSIIYRFHIWKVNRRIYIIKIIWNILRNLTTAKIAFRRLFCVITKICGSIGFWGTKIFGNFVHFHIIWASIWHNLLFFDWLSPNVMSKTVTKIQI